MAERHRWGVFRWTSTAAALVIVLAAGPRPTEAQITTGNVTGTVTDSQGGAVPGATVVLVHETQEVRIGPLVTNTEGVYSFPNVTAGSYRVEVTLSGFRPASRGGVSVSGGGRVAVPPLVLDVGGIDEAVQVVAGAELLQSASGERSYTVNQVMLDNLPIGADRGFRNFANLLPGVAPTGGVGASQQNMSGRLGGGGMDFIMMDGIGIMDTGNNGQMNRTNVPVDAIAEVRVLTQGYQAEFGRSSGLQISAVTRSGSNQFRGSLYYIERNSDWDKNSWQNVRNNVPKPVSQEHDWGYSIGGPVGRPGGDNKLFFFYHHEYNPRTAGGATTNRRYPTALERLGDFSQTLDNNGALYNAIYDPASGLPKSQCVQGGPTAACFQDGGVLGRIPMNRLYGPGMALLNHYPMPTHEQQPNEAFNYTAQTPVRDTLSWQPTMRIDYHATPTLRFSGRYSPGSERVQVNPGAVPGWTDNINPFPLVHVFASTVNYTVNATTFVEGTYGFNQNQIGNPLVSPFANRNNIICPPDLASQVPNCSMAGISLLFPDAGVMDQRYYGYNALLDLNTPMLQGNVLNMPPQVAWTNAGTASRIGNAPDSYNFPGAFNLNRNHTTALSVTKIYNSHTFKAGFTWERSLKTQNVNPAGAVPPFQGLVNFGPLSTNPLDTSFPFANAALGAFASFGQSSRFTEANLVYNQLDFYVQDNWKVNRRLTLDYGMRFVNQGPFYDRRGNVTAFFPDQWDPAQAPALYVPGCVGGVAPCSGNNRQAMNPVTGELLGPGTISLVGLVVPGTGNPANGIRVGGEGIDKAGYKYPKLAYAPRIGAAYDVTGEQRFVLRGSFGVFYDRNSGGTVIQGIANPPFVSSTTAQWGSLAALDNASVSFGSVPTIAVYHYESKLPTSLQWNGGMQMALPWASSLGVEYVAHHSFNMNGNTHNSANSRVQLNQINLGAYFTPEAQDPTMPGTRLNDNLLRPFRGYNDILYYWPRFERTFHSIQSTFNRRFRNGLQLGVNHTLTLSDRGTQNMPNAQQLRLDYLPDGSFTIRDDQKRAEELFGRDQGIIRHIVQGSFVLDPPNWQRSGTLNRVVGAVVNDWQLSGIFRIRNGNPYDIDYTYQSGGGALLTGSPHYAGRVAFHGDIGSGCSSNQYAQFNNQMVAGGGNAGFPLVSPVVSGPVVGSDGLESGRNMLRGCAIRNVDLAISREIRLGKNHRLQLRADVFNAFNIVNWTGRQNQIQFNSPTDMTVRNSQFLPDGSVDPNRLRPNQAGFGAVTGAEPMRNVQLQIRYLF